MRFIVNSWLTANGYPKVSSAKESGTALEVFKKMLNHEMPEQAQIQKLASELKISPEAVVELIKKCED
ncbi:MAG: hypothetical protein ACFBSC_12770 [Microcoleaceae cyanobacterium]